MAQGSDDPVRSRVTDVAQQDWQLQGVLPDRVPQPPEDLPGRGAGRGVHGRANQDQAGDPVRMAHGQLDGDLAAEGVAQHRHGRQSARFQPRGQVIGMLGDAQDPPRVAAEPEARQVNHVDRVVAGQLGGQRHQVAVGDRQPMDQDQRESAAGAGERAAGMSRDASDRPPAALEAPGRARGAGCQPVPVTGSSQGARTSSPRWLIAQLH
jgi:hypothetical protein